MHCSCQLTSIRFSNRLSSRGKQWVQTRPPMPRRLPRKASGWLKRLPAPVASQYNSSILLIRLGPLNSKFRLLMAMETEPSSTEAASPTLHDLGPSPPQPVEVSTGEESLTPVVALLDVDAFECQIWQREFPDSRGKPCVVVNSSGRILAATHEAKAVGISRRSTPHIDQVLQKFTENRITVFRKDDKFGKQDQTKVREAGWHFKHCVLRFMTRFPNILIEVASNDEIYFDLSAEVSNEISRWREKYGGSKCPGVVIPRNVVWERKVEKGIGPICYKLPCQPIKNEMGMNVNLHVYSNKNEERIVFGAVLMGILCDQLMLETGLHASAGVAKNKLLAKIACGINKPEKVTALHEMAFLRVSKTLPISAIPGLGGSLGEELKSHFEIDTVYCIRKLGYQALEEKFGDSRAQEIWSRTLGQDTSPVTPHIMNDTIKVNKPLPEIRSIHQLDKVLANMTMEINQILYEERIRHRRKTEVVRVCFKFGRATEEELAESHVFSIRNYAELRELPEQVILHFHSLPHFDIKSVHITQLTMVLYNFVSLEPENLFFTPFGHFHHQLFFPAQFKVYVRPPFSYRTPRLQHQTIGAFRITSNLQYLLSSVSELPKTIQLKHLKKLLGLNLLTNFKESLSCARLIRDYISYDERRMLYFMSWWCQQGRGHSSLQDIKFVGVIGRIIRALKTPVNKTYGDWETYAMNLNGIIYLWEERGPRDKPTFSAEGSYIGEFFEHLCTGRKGPEHFGEPVDAFDKVFPIQKLTIGSQKLLLLSNIDGQDPSGQFVQVQLTTDENYFTRENESFVLERHLKLWAQAVISGSKKVILGKKDLNYNLTYLEGFETAQLPQNRYSKQCFFFLERLLEWMETQLPEHNDRLVKKFSWTPGTKAVTVITLPEQEMKKTLLHRVLNKIEKHNAEHYESCFGQLSPQTAQN